MRGGATRDNKIADNFLSWGQIVWWEQAYNYNHGKVYHRGITILYWFDKEISQFLKAKLHFNFRHGFDRLFILSRQINDLDDSIGKYIYYSVMTGLVKETDFF